VSIEPMEPPHERGTLSEGRMDVAPIVLPDSPRNGERTAQTGSMPPFGHEASGLLRKVHDAAATGRLALLDARHSKFSNSVDVRN
jgi:hypothetical protein